MGWSESSNGDLLVASSGRKLRLWSDCVGADWLESSLYAHANLYLKLDTYEPRHVITNIYNVAFWQV